MSDEKRVIDWAKVQVDYRAGVKPLRLIAQENGITHGAITQRAKKDEWTRDLAAKIKSQTQDKLSKAALSKELSTATVVSEKQVVEANAELQYKVQMGHRSGLSKLRTIKDKLVDHIESVVDNFKDLAEVIAMIREPDENGQDKANDRLKKMMDRSVVIDDLKKLSEIDEKVRKGEREAFGIDDGRVESPIDQLLLKIASER